MLSRFFILLLVSVKGSSVDVEIEADGEVHTTRKTDDSPVFGVDHSFPMQRRSKPFGEQAAVYLEFLEGCSDAYGREMCLESEQTRLEMNRKQPGRMTNFTSAGYAKVQAPPAVMAILNKFWEANTGGKTWNLDQEGWPPGNTYINHWETPTEVLDIHGPTGLSSTNHAVIQGQVGQTLKTWLGGGVDLVHTSTYGVRSYGEGSILAPHIDRLPLVISAIINVAQSVVEPWPLEVIDLSGRAVNVTIEPGEMILYESHSVIHGRPYPMQGEYYANVFLHFEPVGYTKQIIGEMGDEDDAWLLFEEALRESHASDSLPSSFPTPAKLPPYIVPGTEDASRWLQEFVFSRQEEASNEREPESSSSEKPKRTKGAREAHILAAQGDLAALINILKDSPDSVDAPDVNGWTPLHEAARSGNVHIVKFLLKEGVDINARTNGGRGGTPLWLAEHSKKPNQDVIELLKSKGGKSVSPKAA